MVDRLTKHGHFSAMGPRFTKLQVAGMLVHDVIKLHGVPAQIISDHHFIFMNEFKWELFKIQETMLVNSNTYHPQTDGQTEVLNQCLEDYLRSFTTDNPRQWTRYLPWAEWHYNTEWHYSILCGSAIRMTPFEAVFGRSPPSLVDYITGDSTMASVDELLADQVTILQDLKNNSLRAQ